MDLIAQCDTSRQHSNEAGRRGSRSSDQSVREQPAPTVEQISLNIPPLAGLSSPNQKATPLCDLPARISLAAAGSLARSDSLRFLENRQQPVIELQSSQIAQRGLLMAPRPRTHTPKAQVEAILPGKEASPDPFPEAQYLNAWRFRQPVQNCPFFFPACSCMKNGVLYSPFYYSTIKQDHEAAEYVKKMAYIPGISSLALSRQFRNEKQSLGPLSCSPRFGPADRSVSAPFALCGSVDSRCRLADFDASGLGEIQNDRILDDCTVNFAAPRRATALLHADDQGEESGICYVCHKSGTEGEFWVGCSNLERHTERDGWAHGICVGFDHPPVPEVPWWCHDCEAEFSEWQPSQVYQRDRTLNARKAEIENLNRRDINSIPKSSTGNVPQTYSNVHRLSGRKTWNSGGNGIPADVGDYSLTLEPIGGYVDSTRSDPVKVISRRSRKGKRAVENIESSDSPETEEPKLKRKRSSQGINDEHTQTLVVRFLKEEITARNLTEKKWQAISEKLAKHGINRSQWSIKAWWSRRGRLLTGFDERQNPTGRKLVTSKQDPEDRRRARERKKAESGQIDVSNNQKQTEHRQKPQKSHHVDAGSHAGSHAGFAVEDDDDFLDGPQTEDDNQAEQTRVGSQHGEPDYSWMYGL